MSFADISLIFDLLHAVSTCSPMIATEYDPASAYSCEQVLRGFGILHQHALIDAELVVDASGYRTIDYQVVGLTDRGRRIYQVLMQTQLPFGGAADQADLE
ncbi:hypothetical protein [Dyella acidiphila]|uniref:Uncharacterized protein n=1 Tax=Dyella acidiphila TaxID=2775866 RepID=A0ABR9GBB6_9GAMM|nr:hypothetical protein [Dyella acidiphila]MBE1161318.1 hypothetical protein [Dyella acidiphila]